MTSHDLDHAHLEEAVCHHRTTQSRWQDPYTLPRSVNTGLRSCIWGLQLSSAGTATRAVIQPQGFLASEKVSFQNLVKSDPVMKSCASAFIVQNKSQEDIYQNWAKS